MMRGLCVLFLVLGVTGTALGDVVERDIGDRRFLLYEPPGLASPAPVLLALHGGFGSARQFRRALSIEDEARRLGFRVAYLEGIGGGPRGRLARTWNAGRCCGPALRRQADDLGYVTGVIDTLRREGRAGRVAMIGHSNGAMMVYRMLCQGSRRIAGAVIVSGSLMVDRCRVLGAPRVLALHGAADPNVPVSGGLGRGPSGASFTSLATSVATLIRAGAQVEQEVLPGVGHRLGQIDRALPDGLAVSVSRFLFPG